MKMIYGERRRRCAYCGRLNYRVLKTEAGENLCLRCVHEPIFECDRCKDYFRVSQRTELNGKMYCPKCIKKEREESDLLESQAFAIAGEDKSLSELLDMMDKMEFEGRQFQDFVDIPISDFIPKTKDIKLNTRESETTSSNGFASLKEHSFLADMGYNTGLSDDERHRVLCRAAKIHGKTRLMNHLQFLLILHQTDSKMENPCDIWSDDYDYVKDL